MSRFGLCVLLVVVFSLELAAQEANINNISSVPAPEVLPENCRQLSYGRTSHYDYTNYDDYTNYIGVLHDYHFTPKVEALIDGESDRLLGDLDYVLRQFPNHHRALASLSKFEFQVEDAKKQLLENGLGIECYFQYASNFRPADGIVRLIYATYLHKKGNVERSAALLERALVQYNSALQLMPDSAEVHYNLGLFYIEMDKINLALMHGSKAYELGFPLQGLKDKLKKKGVWNNTVSQY